MFALASAAQGQALPESEPEAPLEEPAPPPSDLRELQVLGMEADFIEQHLFPFRSPYAGASSLPAHGDTELTETYVFTVGSRLAENLHLYASLVEGRGSGVGDGDGLGAPTNGDLVRVGAAKLGADPFLATAYLRYIVPYGEETEHVERDEDDLPGWLSTHRVEFKLGKMQIADEIDKNRYANSTHEQFMNWALINNTAWDYVADARDSTYGLLGAWITPKLEVRLGLFQMVTEAEGHIWDNDLTRAYSENLELVWRAEPDGLAVRLLAYQNNGRMGDYASALATAAKTGSTPDIVADDRPGRRKFGYGLNLELPLGANGNTGLFARLGWNDGATESFMFAEADRAASLGFQFCGCHWGRSGDRLGIGIAANGLSDVHRNYLAAGGYGFIVGDGRLNYGIETVAELYYRIQFGRHVQVSPDYQYFVNPGYNKDRGPAQVIGVRLRVYAM